MSLRKGLARAGRTLDSPRSAAAARILTLDNPAGWLSGDETAALSRDKAMKISTVNRCVEVLSNSVAVLTYEALRQQGFPGLLHCGEMAD